MRKSLIFLFVFASLATVVSSAFAQETTVKSSTLVGSGVGNLSLEGATVTDGLAIRLQEPNSSDELWAVVVMNQTDQEMQNVRLKVEQRIGEEWYIVDIPSIAHIFPITLKPGEVGISALDELGNVYEDWDEARATIDTDPENAIDAVDIGLTNVKANNQVISGTIVNTTAARVSDTWVYFYCVEESGKIVSESVITPDIRGLDPNATFDFEFGPSDLVCANEDELIVTALGEPR